MFEERIPIRICGQDYEIVGDPAEALYYTSIAQYVEDKMKEIQNSTHIVSTQKIAVLAALNIADELLHEREKKTHTSTHSGKKTQHLIKLLDGVLAGTEGYVPHRTPVPAHSQPVEETAEFKLESN